VCAARLKGKKEMIVRRATALAGMAFILGAAAAHAGPCTDRIYQTDLEVAKLSDSAAQGGTETEPALRRQPPPGSIATDEAGDLTSEQAQAITQDMDEARHADDAGDLAGCEKALGDVDRILDR
jgi:hypothetical protein